MNAGNAEVNDVVTHHINHGRSHKHFPCMSGMTHGAFKQDSFSHFILGVYSVGYSVDMMTPCYILLYICVFQYEITFVWDIPFDSDQTCDISLLGPVSKPLHHHILLNTP